ncbi:mitotic checkpoint [Olea europaea subsp. europaea]|uniref:Mitotic checkpoint n=1 Tax=Olea europaea subsp. europaea TaxID=158383 RepID=A0A8S0SAU3_OLEEU|nr:mitotic checkpoint [Olea europaea subsp. europaea]
MNGDCLNFKNPIRDAISRIRFAPHYNNLLISSWDSSLRLCNVDKSELRLEVPTEAALLDCCFEGDSVALSAGSDGSICRYDMHLGTSVTIGNHDDLATCAEYSDETCLIVTAGWDRKIMFWDSRATRSLGCLSNLGVEVESLSLSGFNLMVAIRSSVYIYDLRNCHESVQAKESFMDIQLKCVRPIHNFEGFVVGSTDGRVALEYLGQSKSKNEGYAFRCHPKGKNGRHHLVAVNDIAFSPSNDGVFVTADNEGYATTWDARSKRRLVELPRYPNSIASLSYNHDGQLLAVASSYTYQEANEREELPQIFIHKTDDIHTRSGSTSSSMGNY